MIKILQLKLVLLFIVLSFVHDVYIMDFVRYTFLVPGSIITGSSPCVTMETTDSVDLQLRLFTNLSKVKN